MLQKLLFYLLILSSLLAVSCSFFIEEKAEEFKSENYSLKFALSHWKNLDADDSDYAFIQENSKSIIFVNSFCKKHDSTTLNHLISHLFAGIDQVKVEEQSTLTLFGREALKAKASGKLDGVQSYFVMYVVNKNRCTYDFVLISNSEEMRRQDEKDLNTLLQGVTIE